MYDKFIEKEVNKNLKKVYKNNILDKSLFIELEELLQNKIYKK